MASRCGIVKFDLVRMDLTDSGFLSKIVYTLPTATMNLAHRIVSSPQRTWIEKTSLGAVTSWMTQSLWNQVRSIRLKRSSQALRVFGSSKDFTMASSVHSPSVIVVNSFSKLIALWLLESASPNHTTTSFAFS